MMRITQWTRQGRRALGAVVSIAVLNIAGCGNAPADSEQTDTRSGAVGSTQGQKTINNLKDLMNMDATGNYLLVADLDASRFTWHYGYFYGTLDGGNHTISNLTTSDTIGQAAGLFVYAQNALIKNLKLTNLHVSGTADVGGLVGDCVDCAIDSVAVEGAVSAPNYVGGIAGGMTGGSITKSYFKGQVTGGAWGAGGLVGLTSDDDTGLVTITSSYAQAASQTAMLVSGSTASGIHPAGGIVGAGAGMWVNDVYAVGNVSGRGSVGGLVGQASCDGTSQWLVYKGIYRGNVTDANLAPPGGWAGTLGKATDLSCDSRTTLLYFNRDLDNSTSFLAVDQRPSTTSELIKPTAPTPANGGIFCPPSLTIVPCGDDPFTAPPWDFGTSTQNTVLAKMPGPNVQLR